MSKIIETFKFSVLKQSRHGKLILKNMQLGLSSAAYISKHLVNNWKLKGPQIRVLDLSNNNLRD
jgi:hypothetical protein